MLKKIFNLKVGVSIVSIIVALLAIQSTIALSIVIVVAVLIVIKELLGIRKAIFIANLEKAVKYKVNPRFADEKYRQFKVNIKNNKAIKKQAKKTAVDEAEKIVFNNTTALNQAKVNGTKVNYKMKLKCSSIYKKYLIRTKYVELKQALSIQG